MAIIAVLVIIAAVLVIRRIAKRDEIHTDDMYYLDGDYQWKRVNHGAER